MSEAGVIFDIQRSSLHDGPGIRTTVFLKGCPLECAWCHNPEAVSPSPQLFFFAERCRLCGACARVCPNGVHRIADGVHAIDYARCELCGACVEACTTRSLKIVGTKKSVDEIMAVVMADLDFYRNSGGGITLSGGEPLIQFSFALELLRRSRALSVHTCVETSGYVSSARFAEALPYIDLLLFDYKATNDEEHRRHTGVSRRLILDNLGLAYRAGVSITLRCPIIPGVNDNDEHFIGIRFLDTCYPLLRGIELLPYHAMGNSKRPAIGAPVTFPDLGTTPPEVAESWLRRLRELGCAKATLG